MSTEKKLLIAILVYLPIVSWRWMPSFLSNFAKQLLNIEVVLVGYEVGPYNTSLVKDCLVATKSFDEVPNPDIIIVPGGFDNRLLAEDQPVVKWIRKVNEITLYTTVFSEASLLLGAARLLNGVHANPHWAVLDQLRKYGAIVTNEPVVQEGKIFTSAGVSAGIELGLTVVKVIIDEQN